MLFELKEVELKEVLLRPARGGGGGGVGDKNGVSSFHIFDQGCRRQTRRKNRTEI